MKYSLSLQIAIQYWLCLVVLAIFSGSKVFAQPSGNFSNQKPIVVGLNADMSLGSAESGKAIFRGISIAMHEINEAGGILDRPVVLKVADHQGSSIRGQQNMKQFDASNEVVAVFGGLHTPVVFIEKKKLFDTNLIKLPYLIPWAAGTPLVENPWIFRVSLRDEHAGPFLVNSALSKGHKKIALLLELTPWGKSNHQSMTAALAKKGLKPHILKWFKWNVPDQQMERVLGQIADSSADVVLFVGNSPEGITILRTLSNLETKKQFPVISHWGITGGKFAYNLGNRLNQIDLSFIQTYSFIKNEHEPKNQAFLQSAKAVFGDKIKDSRDLFSPAGTAHAYDLLYLLKQAIEKANTTDRKRVREALENLEAHEGLVKTYDPAFKAGLGIDHDALTSEDFHMAKYEFDEDRKKWLIVPAE